MTIPEIEDSLNEALTEVRDSLPAGLTLAVKIDELPGLVKIRLGWSQRQWYLHNAAVFAVGLALGAAFL